MMSFFKKDDKDRKKKTSENDVSSSSDQTLNPDESTLNPVLSSSSKSSIDSSIQPQTVLPPKPKKGILKTMSKFGHVNLTPKLYQKIDLIKNVAQPAQTPEEPKSIEASIPNFSKRNSVFLNESVVNSAQILTDLKNIPIYIIPENVSSDSVLEPYLHRKVYVPVRLIPQIKIHLNTKNFENGQTVSEESRNIPIIVDNLDLEFLPGDQLMFINEENILGRSLNEVKNILNDLCQLNKEDLIKFTVRTRLDYSDFILKNFYLNLSQHSEKLRKKLSNDQISPQPIDPLEINQVWYVQPNGYLSAKIFAKVIHKNSNTSLESLSGNNVTEVINFKIKLDNGKIIEVSEDCLEKSNPIQFDYCSDLTKLRFINETSLIHCIRQRFITLNLNYTLIGNQNLLAIGANEDKNMIQMIKNLKQLDLPPHVYSQTQLVYKNMLSNRQDQSIVLMGHSNSAKSVNTKLIMNYLFKIAGSSSASNFNENKLNALFTLLNAFCSVKTETNQNGSNRFLNVTLLEFSHSGQLVSLLLQLIAVDPTRLVYQPNNESNYLIFYYLLFGANSSIKTELGLNNEIFSIKENQTGNIFFNSESYLTAGENSNYSTQFDLILSAFKQLNFIDNEVKSILCILGAILHLGRANATNSQSPNSKGQFLNIPEAQRAANLLGISFNQLNDFIFSLTNPPGTKQNILTPQECLQGFALGLYQECLNLIVNGINRTFKINFQTVSNSMLLLDPPGFQNKTSASYSDLIINYLNERLQLLFFQLNFINPIEKCAQEGLEIDLVEHIPDSPSSLINWFDRPSSNSILNRGETESSGLLWLLEEQMNETKKNFKEKLTQSDLKQNFISINSEGSNFLIYHQFGNFPIEYNLTEWLDNFNKEFSTQRNASICLQESKKDVISHTFYQNMCNLSNANLNNIDSSSSGTLKRQASVRKMLTMSKKKTFLINFKLQIDSLFDSLRKTKCNFTFCLLSNKQNSQLKDIDLTLMRKELKAYQILSACRIYRQGYPEYLSLEEFVRRFSMFIQHGINNEEQKENSTKDLSLLLIKNFDLDNSFYKVGNTQIFFKAGILAKLEDKRDEKVNDFIIRLQANCRKFMARRTYERKKIQDSAIRCVQKNIRIWFALRKWKWWRLYTNLMPILNVQNNELVLKQLHGELDDLKRRNEKLTNEKQDLKLLNQQLETKLMNLQTEYVEEHAANAGTIDLLEVETSERIRLERELNELRPLYNETLKKLELIETEMLELRLYNTKKSIEQELEKDELDGLSVNGSFNTKQNATNTGQLEALKRENEQLKRQLKQEKENIQIFSLNERTFFENKLKEKDSEILELEKQTSIHKRKYQKMCEEMQDLERLCDENKIRNRELEKIQLKFDSEMNSLKSKYENEKDLREKCERERDSIKYELFALKNDLDTQKSETNYQIEKCERLERDLREYEAASMSKGVGADQFLKMKSQIRDLENKMRDQDEELDEQTFLIQQLEQTKLKLEMQLEKEKQKWTREIAEKESEMDDLRFNTQKKIKAIENQLEEESELSSNLQREKRELERKMRELTANGMNGKKSNAHSADMHTNEAINDYIIKLKRHMLKYKTLAFDAQTQLEKLKENIPKQSILKALKAQLEDSEFSKANALKSKQLLQVELDNLQQQLDDVNSHKHILEEQNMHLNRELSNLKSELEEQERDSDEILKKYQMHIQNYSLDSHRFIDLSNQVDILTIENRLLKDKIRELEEKCSSYETNWVDRTQLNKLENKQRELESKLDFEITHRIKIQSHLDRVKQLYENSQNEIELILSREKKCEDNLRKAQRHNKELMEEYGDLKKKLIDLEETRKRIAHENEILEQELETCKNEIKINKTRLEAFQNAFNSMNNESEEDDDDEEQIEEDDSDIEYQLSEIIDTSDKAFKFLNSSMSKMSVKSNEFN